MIRSIFISMLLAATAAAQTTDPVAAAREYRKAHAAQILRDYADLLAMPNLATDAPNIRRNAERIRDLLQARGVQTRLLEVPDAPPIVHGEIGPVQIGREVCTGCSIEPPIIIYAHYDGQPVDPAQWSSPPWQPVFRDQQRSEER